MTEPEKKERLRGRHLTLVGEPEGPTNFFVLCPRCQKRSELLGEQFNVKHEIRGKGKGDTPEVCHDCGKTLQKLSPEWDL